MLALNNRFRVEIQALKRTIDAGTLGEIYYAKTGWMRRRWGATVRGWFMEKEKSGGGPLIDLGVHMLDLALWLMGSPKATRVSGAVYDKLAKEMGALLGPLDIEDLGAGMIHLDNGATIFLETSWMGYIEREHVFTELLGTRGGAKYERWGREAPTMQPAPPFQLFTTIADEQINAIPTHIILTPEEMLRASFANEMRHFAECVRDNVQPASRQEAWRVVGIRSIVVTPLLVADRAIGALAEVARSERLKRWVDLVGAGLGLAIFSPLMLLSALAVRLDSPGASFFVQTRAGKDGRPFRLYKFRTMVRGAEEQLPHLRRQSVLPAPLVKFSALCKQSRWRTLRSTS